MRKNNFKTCIFDLDGTLIDSLEDIADSVNSVLGEYNFTTYKYDEYRFFIGNGLRNLVKKCLPEKEKEDSNIEKYYSRTLDIYKKYCLEKTRLYKGIENLLDELSNRKIKLAVLSNKPDELTCKISNELLKKWDFEAIIGLSDRFPRKPDPTSALHIAGMVGDSPQEILYLGDSDVDMKTAVAAGFYAVGVTWGFRPREELIASGAQLLIEHPQELIEKLFL